MTRAQEVMEAIINKDDTVSEAEKQKLVNHIHDVYDSYKPVGWSHEKIIGFIITGYVPGLTVEDVKLLLSKKRSPKYDKSIPGFWIEIS